MKLAETELLAQELPKDDDWSIPNAVYGIQSGPTRARFSKTGVSGLGLAIFPSRVGQISLDI